MCGALFYHRTDPLTIDAMSFSQLTYWYDWFKAIQDAKSKKLSEYEAKLKQNG